MKFLQLRNYIIHIWMAWFLHGLQLYFFEFSWTLCLYILGVRTQLRPPRDPQTEARRHTLLSRGLCYKNALKKIDHFSNCCQIAIYASKFKILTLFGILRFLPFQIRRERRQNRRFWTSPGRFSKNCRKSGPFFCEFRF